MQSSKVFFINEDNESTAKVTFAKLLDSVESSRETWTHPGEATASRVGRFHGHAINGTTRAISWCKGIFTREVYCTCKRRR